MNKTESLSDISYKIDKQIREMMAICSVGDRIRYMGIDMLVIGVCESFKKPTIRCHYKDANGIIREHKFYHRDLAMLKSGSACEENGYKSYRLAAEKFFAKLKEEKAVEWSADFSINVPKFDFAPCPAEPPPEKTWWGANADDFVPVDISAKSRIKGVEDAYKVVDWMMGEVIRLMHKNVVEGKNVDNLNIRRAALSVAACRISNLKSQMCEIHGRGK